MADLNAREIALLTPLAVLMVVMGVMPQPFLNASEPATTYLLETIERKRLAALEEAERRQQTTQATFDGERFAIEPLEPLVQFQAIPRAMRFRDTFRSEGRKRRAKGDFRTSLSAPHPPLSDAATLRKARSRRAGTTDSLKRHSASDFLPQPSLTS